MYLRGLLRFVGGVAVALRRASQTSFRPSRKHDRVQPQLDDATMLTPFHKPCQAPMTVVTAANMRDQGRRVTVAVVEAHFSLSESTSTTDNPWSIYVLTAGALERHGNLIDIRASQEPLGTWSSSTA